MNDQELRALQAPLKDRYRTDPESAKKTLRVRGALDVDQIAVRIETGRGAMTEAGLHPMAGGDPRFACSADMLLESLIGCAGVTLCAVATAMSIPIASGTIAAEGDVDFRGTLGISKEIPVGFLAIRIQIELQTTADDAQLQKLATLTERYCVVAQSLSEAARPTVTIRRV
ncbi:MAG TPA: OsmC family protein [Planctomycetaceae bacterium]|nr:OsmC family protein [Planctomycetaceae bacterium]